MSRRSLDALTMLAVGVQAQPGVYALLLGSGVSTAAGIPTGWGVIQDLVRKAAAARDPADVDGRSLAADDPEAWWTACGDGQPLDYSNLLEQLAPTTAARRDLLAGYFEATEEEASAGEKVPTRAHRAIAQLVRRGSVRVVITTNFDRLMEHALDEVGVSYQVIHRPDQIAAMTPLVHASATVVKVHGDYHDQDMRNTVTELAGYPDELVGLLGQIFDEYGLVVSGWSADWDRALVAAVETRRSRRYPLYWDQRSSKAETARRLIALHSGHVVPAASADELFSGLLERVEALDKLAEPPVTTAIAIARLKRYLPDPTRRIDLHDLVMQATGDVVDYIADQPVGVCDTAGLQATYDGYLATVTPLLHLVTTGVWHDQNDVHRDLWRDVVQRLLDARTRPDGVFYDVLLAAQHYPALLVMQTAGITAVHREREALLLYLLTAPKWTDPTGPQWPLPAMQALHYHRVLSGGDINQLPGWNGQQWLYPASHMLRADLRDALRELIPDDLQYKASFDAYEYRLGLVLEHTQDLPGAVGGAFGGEFLGSRPWRDETLPTEDTFRSAAAQAGPDWPWWPFVGGKAGFEAHLTAHREKLKQLRRN